MKTLVLEIQELYRIIPASRVLEGKNFKDVGELLKDLIAAVESDGKWQFIQYVNNKPSLFIIREESAPALDYEKAARRMKDLLAQIEDKKDAVDKLVNIPTYTPPEEIKEEEKEAKKDKLPWEDDK